MARRSRIEIYCENQGICPLVKDKNETPIIRKTYENRLFRIRKVHYSCNKGECTIVDRLNSINCTLN